MADDELVFLHLSDIHFRRDSGGTYDIDEDLRNELVLDARTLAASLGTPNGILISGDIAFSGCEAEYVNAKDWLQTVCDGVGSDPDDVWCVPGNHDVDQACVKASKILRDIHNNLRQCEQQDLDTGIDSYMHDRVTRELLFDTITEYNKSFAAKFSCLLSPDCPVWQEDFTLNDRSLLRVHGLNSTIVSDHHDNDHKKVILGRYQIPQREIGVTDMVICHHPPEWWSDSETVEHNLDGRARVQLFGHKHHQRLVKINNTLRISAGAVHPDRREPSWIPRYNWLVLSVSSTGQNRQLRVAVYPRVWAQTDARFIPDSNFCDGQDHIEYFLTLDDWTPPPEARSLTGSPDATPTTTAVAPSIVTTGNSVMNPARILTYRFFELPHVSRIDIARDLGLLRDEDEGLQDFQLFERVFARAADENLLSEVWNKVEECHNDGKYASNPFADES